MTEDEKKKLEEVLGNRECPPLELTTVSGRELTLLQQQIRDMALSAGVPLGVMEASDHDFYCRCSQCREWWRQVGPEEDGTFGPFSREEIYGNV